MSEPQTKHEIKTCPRCSQAFECKANNPVYCDCARVQLTEDTLLAIECRYGDCLCLTCLTVLGGGGSVEGPAAIPAQARR